MNRREDAARDLRTRVRIAGAAMVLGAVSALVALVPTYTLIVDHYPDWMPLIAWSGGPFVTALVLTRRHPELAWELAFWIEVGVILGIVFDLRIRSSLAIESTVWPLAIVLVMVVSLPFILVGTFVGRERGRMKQRMS